MPAPMTRGPGARFFGATPPTSTLDGTRAQPARFSASIGEPIIRPVGPWHRCGAGEHARIVRASGTSTGRLRSRSTDEAIYRLGRRAPSSADAARNAMATHAAVPCADDQAHRPVIRQAESQQQRQVLISSTGVLSGPWRGGLQVQDGGDGATGCPPQLPLHGTLWRPVETGSATPSPMAAERHLRNGTQSEHVLSRSNQPIAPPSSPLMFSDNLAGRSEENIADEAGGLRAADVCAEGVGHPSDDKHFLPSAPEAEPSTLRSPAAFHGKGDAPLGLAVRHTEGCKMQVGYGAPYTPLLGFSSPAPKGTLSCASSSSAELLHQSISRPAEQPTLEASADRDVSLHNRMAAAMAAACKAADCAIREASIPLDLSLGKRAPLSDVNADAHAKALQRAMFGSSTSHLCSSPNFSRLYKPRRCSQTHDGR